MARDLNKVTLIGRLATDPELRATPSGQTVGNFRVATSRQWNDAQGQPQTQTEFSQIVAWGKLADLANQYLRKGRQVYVEGRLQTRSWTDKANQKHWRTEVVAENIIFLGAPTANAASAAGAAPEEAGEAPPSPDASPGKPAEPKVPVSAGAPRLAEASRGASADKPTEELEEIRIEDIPF